MAVLPLRYAPAPVLQAKAKRVRKIDAALRKLIADMIETMRAENGVGLAANQIGDLRKVAVIQLPEDEEAQVLINPEVTHREDEREVEEGCLSIPGYHAFVIRSIWVKAKGLDHRSRIVRLRANGLLAQALEHEIDHLNGILYTDHLESHQELLPNEPEVEVEDASAEVVAI